MRSRLRGLGFAGLLWVIVALWAVAAAGLIVGTMVNAWGIVDEASDVTVELSDVDENLDGVGRVERTAALAQQIESAVQPLAPRLRETVSITSSIAVTASAIRRRTVSIESQVEVVRARAASVQNAVAVTQDEVETIARRFADVVAVARSIDNHVARSATETVQLLAALRPARRLLRQIRRQVREIHEHANAVNCAPVPAEDNDACDSHAHPPGA